ncbi:MAG TPA: gluconate 5-dehydrogenase [Opitutae bacterium]|nr:gluconate 5-dehydrogenase [Opitutae bacterium]
MKPAELFSLKGQTAVIIGGTGELCGAIAEGFAAAGAHVVLVGRDATKAEARLSKIKASGGSGEFAVCEATDKSALIALRDKLLARAPIDILINGAGTNSPTPFLEIAESEIDRILNVNVKSVILGCQVFGEAMVKAGRGSIINLGSESAIIPLSRVFTYSASKAAVHNLSKNLAREWAGKGVRVNTLVPGFFPAEQNRKVLSPDRVANILAKTPMGRFGEAHELVGAALFLASQAGSFTTGSEVVVDGGFSAQSI